jgi:hypothetical protein
MLMMAASAISSRDIRRGVAPIAFITASSPVRSMTLTLIAEAKPSVPTSAITTAIATSARIRITM